MILSFSLPSPPPLTEAEANEEFETFLEDEGLSPCKCGRHIDRGDVGWNNAQTEAGTGCSFVEIQCLNCQEEIASWFSWYSEIDSFEELVECVLKDYRPNGRDRG